MTGLVLASLLFPLSHFLISSTPLRAMSVNRLGEKRYALGYSLLAVASLAWLIIAYRSAPGLPLLECAALARSCACPGHCGFRRSGGGRAHDAESGHRNIGSAVRSTRHCARRSAYIAKPLLLGGWSVLDRTNNYPGRRGRAADLRQHRLGRYCRGFHPRRQEGTPAWKGMGRLRGGDLEFTVSCDRSGSPATRMARDRAVANCTWRSCISRRTCFARRLTSVPDGNSPLTSIH